MVLLVICFLTIIKATSGMVDVYISKEEMWRTLGVNAKLMYVENGAPNDYALKFTYRIQQNVSQMHFLWQNHAAYDIFYSLSVSAADDGALSTMLSLPPTGRIPRQLEQFTVTLQCTGRVNGHVPVDVLLNYTWPSKRNQTRLRLMRQKICGRSQPRSADYFELPRNDLFDPRSTGDADSVDRAAADSPELADSLDGNTVITGSQIFYISIGVLAGFIVVLASCIIAYFARAQRPADNKHHFSVASTSPVNGTQTQPFLRSTDSPSSNSRYTAVTGGKASSAYSAIERRSAAVASPPVFCAEPPVVDLPAVLESLFVDRQLLQVGDVEAEGTFGQVFWATLRRTDGEPPSPVIAKTLKETASAAQRRTFLEQALALHGVDAHENTALVAAAAWTLGAPSDGAPWLCYEHAGFGNLKRFLLSSRGALPLQTIDIVFMGLQVVRAMAFLHRNRVLHRDLATRNCLVDENLTVQVSDAALSRDLFPQDYHCLCDNENRPIKWMAPEAIKRHEFSSASDVWSWGVTMWELLCGAQQPFADVDPDDMCRSLLEGARLPQPYNCPDELYGVVFCCWGLHRHSRPSFEQLQVALDDFHTQLAHYI